MNRILLQIHPSDNVLVALIDLEKGEYEHEGKTYLVNEFVKQKHKFTITPLKKGEKVIMYGVPVATCSTDLELGSVITTDNITHFADDAHIRDIDYQWQKPDISKWKDRTFMGYHREDGKVGTSNYWLLIPLVFCENRNIKLIQDALIKGLGYYTPNKYESLVSELTGSQTRSETTINGRVFQNIDGIKTLIHDGGCGGTRQDSEMLLRLLAGYVNHPNVAGATILSLGCQHAQIKWFQELMTEVYPSSVKPVIYLEQQKEKTEENLIKSAISQTIEKLKEVNLIERKPARLDKLIIGLECGGSDGFSGISANPALGATSDKLIALGGSTMLSEFPELNGVEQNLLDRCVTKEVAEKFHRLQYGYAKAAENVGSGFSMNPSPGNIRDGLITDAIKSAGAATKGGTAPISGVLDYAEPIKTQGLHLLCTPGNDVESTTGLAGSGANVILFTTGLGTPTGNPVTPVIKISTNSAVYKKMPDIIDFNAGPIAEGILTLEEASDLLLDYIIKVASGQPTKAMLLEQNDFIPWKRGVSL